MRSLCFLAIVGALLLAGCGGKPAKVTTKNGGNSGENTVTNGKGGGIVKPEEIPEVPPSPEEEEVAKLSTSELVDELGKPHARLIASKVLASKGEAVVPDLVKALKNEDWQVRAGAIFTLGRLGKAAESALPELKKLQETETNDTVKDSIPYCL